VTRSRHLMSRRRARLIRDRHRTTNDRTRIVSGGIGSDLERYSGRPSTNLRNRGSVRPREVPTMQVRCAKCSRTIVVTDVIESSGGRLSHLDCARSHGLTAEERALIFVYCSDHAVARCPACADSFRFTELGVDVLGGNRTNLCPRCRTDLTENVRAHLFGCVLLPSDLRQRTQEVRDAAQILIKRSQQLSDQSHVLIREAEVHLAERQQAL